MHTCRTDDDLTILFSVAKRYGRDAVLRAWYCGPLAAAGPPYGATPLDATTSLPEPRNMLMPRGTSRRE